MGKNHNFNVGFSDYVNIKIWISLKSYPRIKKNAPK